MTDAGRIPRVTPEDVLEVFAERDDRGEPLTAPELADVLDCSRRTALNKLHTLEEQGDVASKKVGGRSKVWWVPIPRDGVDESTASGADPPTSRAAGGVGGEATDERERDVTPPPEFAPSDGGGLDVPEHVETAIRKLDLAPSQDATLFERHAALAAAWRAVRDGDAQERSDFAPVYEAHPAGSRPGMIGS